MTIDRAGVMFGTAFVGLGLAYLLDDLGVWTVQLSIVVPALLILAGIALASTAFVGEDRR